MTESVVMSQTMIILEIANNLTGSSECCSQRMLRGTDAGLKTWSLEPRASEQITLYTAMFRVSEKCCIRTYTAVGVRDLALIRR